MDREQDIVDAYAAGIATLNTGSAMGGSVSATFFLMPCAVAAARAMVSGTGGLSPPYFALSAEERFAVGLIYDVIIEREDIEVTYPRLMEPIIILGSQARDLKRTPLARKLFSKNLTEKAQSGLDTVVSIAASLVREIQADGIPPEADEASMIRPGILIHRRPREIGDNWAAARSYIGGRPRLGDQPWPRNSKGQPLHFAAQLDLAEIAAACGATELPSEGSLAFFIGGGWDGAVVYLPPGSAGDFTDPPDALPPFQDVGLDSPGIDGTMPRWPVGFFPLPQVSGSPEEQYDRQNALIATHFKRPKYGLSAREALGGPAIPRWWQTAFYYVDFLSERRARIPQKIESEQNTAKWAEENLAYPKKHAAKDLPTFEAAIKRSLKNIETIQQQTAEFDAYVEQVKTWCSAHDRWSEMSDAEWERLDAYWGRTPEFSLITESYGRTDLDYLAEKMFTALPSQDTPAFTAFPADVRDIIAQRRAPRPQWWHTAHLILAALDETAAKGGEQASAPAFRDFHTRIAAWVRGRDPWSRMDAGDAASLVAAHQGCRKEFEALLRWKVPVNLESLETVTLNRLLGGEDDAYATLPAGAREMVNREHLLPPGPGHQMFGQFVAIQGNAAEENYDRFMLLQLSYDYLQFWNFGDAGAYQFWIKPDDLKRGNWSAAKLTFECH